MSWGATGRAILRDAGAIGLAVSPAAVAYGALAISSGLSVLQACVLSVLTFTGGSQLAFIGVLGGGGSPWSGTAAGLVLGSRNMLYALRLAPLLRLRGPAQTAVGAHLVVDETTAMALAHVTRNEERAARLAFWGTGLAIFVCWNLGTLLGATVVSSLGDPTTYGLDAALPAAFLALLWPQLTARPQRTVALGGALVALLLTPLVAPGIPVLAAGLVAVGVGLRQAAAESTAGSVG